MSRIELAEPAIKALVALLAEKLPETITELNTETSDDFELEPPTAVLDYMAFSLTLEQGMPLICIQDMPVAFLNDLEFSMESESIIAIAAVVQTGDHRTLAWQLRRYIQAIMQVIQNDRLLGGAGKLLAPGSGIASVLFEGTEPGPLLGDRDPDADGVPPISFRSWTWLLIRVRRAEVG